MKPKKANCQKNTTNQIDRRGSMNKPKHDDPELEITVDDDIDGVLIVPAEPVKDDEWITTDILCAAEDHR